MRSDSASHCCQNPLPGWVRSGSSRGQGDMECCSHRRFKASLSTPAGGAGKSPQEQVRLLCSFPHSIQPGREGYRGLSAHCSTNKDGDTPSVPGPRHGHPGLSLSHWPAPVSAAAAALPRVKGRFYYSHGRANALIQRRGTVPSGQREGGRNLPSTCWKGFKADFTPSSSGSGK